MRDHDGDLPEPESPDDMDSSSDEHEDSAAEVDDQLLLLEPPRPINWNLLSSDDAEAEWLELNAWVNWLRHTYGLPVTIVPPCWHRHPELVWELSALHLHWLGAYDPDQNGSAPIGWHRDFADARERLRDWVTLSGTKLDHDRPTRQTASPGETSSVDGTETTIVNRDEDFIQFVADDIKHRRQAENDFYKGSAE